MFLLTSSLLSPGLKAASNEWGNGGHGVRCSDVENEELLDFYEARANGLDLRDFSNQDEREIVSSVLKRLELFAPKRAERYENIFQDVLKNLRYTKKNEQLIVTQDVGYTSIAKNCEIIQFGLQVQEYGQKETIVIVQQDSWSKLSPINRAGLLLHEVVLLDLATNEERPITTQKARQFIGLLFSEDFLHFTLQKFVGKLGLLNFKYAEAKEVEFPLFYLSNGKKVESTLEWGDESVLKSFSWAGSFQYKDFFNFQCPVEVMKGKTSLEDGRISTIDLSFDKRIKDSCTTVEFPLINNSSFRGEIIATQFTFKEDNLVAAERPEPFSGYGQLYYITDLSGKTMLVVADLTRSFNLYFDKEQRVQKVSTSNAYTCGTFNNPSGKEAYIFREGPIVMEESMWKKNDTCFKR